MRKLNLDHIDAVSRAEGYIAPHIVPNMTPNHRKSLEDDLERLAEIKRWILKVMYEPGLPFPAEVLEVPSDNGNPRKTS